MTLDTTISEAAPHRAVWALGDYALMAEEVMAPLGPVLVKAMGIGPGMRVLDVAAGSGNISLPAAATGADVVSSDLTPELLQRSRARATAQGLAIDYREANAHALPFGNGEFDVVISAIGVQFAPEQQRAADELVRVCKPGGTIGVISWTPEGFFGQMLATIRPYRPSLSQAVPPAALWGRKGYVTGLLGRRVGRMTAVRGMLEVNRFDSAEAVHAYFKNHYGPTIEAYANIGHNRVLSAELDAQLLELAQRHLTNGTMQWEYLLITAEKR
ncbi:methyltransferase domain protein [Mycobacterium parascrofulaceum ATCC BAA-614]|uniref:Methyltransferase domain protein n=1 Tax=Mycobacterium parascrofulaceum ATCC BAA-614 TaxID=525368 RepID=D5PHV3_9MYCO|nr:methyltransferase domain-containing protein [Mycobacterium parascrofulaceum]EFG74352.1 methyltransferase domain protein [Mycobacterium parascrofulaceum ATCC BAA-614]